MTTIAVVLAAALAIAAVVVVALPYLREPEGGDDRLDAPGADEELQLELAEERDRALAALKELEFDHRTGKVGDADYRELVGPLRQAAAAALRAIDRGPRYREAMTTSFETPDLPPEPAPPPDEGTPPTPPLVPEPYPPPDEGTPPTPPVVPEPGSQD